MQKGPVRRSRARAPFRLFDLRVIVEQAPGVKMVCNHRLGDSFELRGENLSLPQGQTFPIYSLAALLPLLPAKQRETHPNDWMTTDSVIACPDPLCGGRFRIHRIGSTVFNHGDVTATPLPRPATPTRTKERKPARRAR
jgi:uncharacterized repeat protein (TIGR04076 family)